MYVDPKDSMRMEQEVNEATAALKGMLGIGGSPTTAVPERTTSPASTPEHHHQYDASGSPRQPQPQEKDASGATSQQPQKSKKKKSNKKKKKGGGADPSNTSPDKPPPKPEKDSAGNRSTSNKRNKQKKKAKNERKEENYAWSAFQSSPDASNLPIPAFSPSTNAEKKIVAVAESGGPIPEPLNQPPQDQKMVKVASGKAVGSDASAGDKEEEKAKSDSDSTDIKQATKPDSPEKVDNSSPEKSEDKIVVDEQSNSSSPSSDAPVSKTGINLAALAAKTDAPSNATPHTAPSMNTRPMMPPQQQQQVMSYGGPLPPMYQQQQQHHMGYHHHQQQQQYPPPPPPGYVTIQVQVPHVLMPGRQMVVTSPAGYPVQVVVPEGIPPGMIIPVHVPAGPPMHMMPPPAQTPYGRYYDPGAHR